MGGFGSGWQGPRKATIEESLVLTASTLVRRKSLVPGAHTFGSWGWTHEGEDEPHATIGYEADLTDPKAMAASSLPIERGAGGLPRPACDDNADLWRAPMVVHMPARAPGRRTVTPGGEAVPSARQPIFRQP